MNSNEPVQARVPYSYPSDADLHADHDDAHHDAGPAVTEARTRAAGRRGNARSTIRARDGRPRESPREAPRPDEAEGPASESMIDPMEADGPAARASELSRALAIRIRARPWGSVAAAIGVGFIVGGALSFRAGRVAIAAAARHLARELLKQLL